MQMSTIPNEFSKYFNNLTATHPICDALGTTLNEGSNLFIYTEPVEATMCVTIIPYGGAPPEPDNYKYETGVQVRLKANSRKRAIETMQAIIHDLHGNGSVCASTNGKVMANQSSPIIFEIQEGGERIITIANFRVKHIKLA